MSKVFCNKPFNHNYIHTNGKMRLCCTTIQDIPTDNGYNLFDASKHTIDDYWNSNRMKEIRRKMIAGEKIRDCERCYRQKNRVYKVSEAQTEWKILLPTLSRMEPSKDKPQQCKYRWEIFVI